jgi:DNA invertase Pin-like site-specific DNA recombinase
MFQMAGIFAEWETAIIRERILAGLARSKVKGTKSGKPIGRARTSSSKEKAIIEALVAGHGLHNVARLVGCGIGTVLRVWREAEEKPS